MLGPDLPLAEYDRGPDGGGPANPTWALFAYEYGDDGSGRTVGRYRNVAVDETLESGVGYWIITTDANESVLVSGDYHSRVDAELGVDSARGSGWNLVGNPFRFATPWAAAEIVDTGGERLSLAEADPGGATVGDTACTDAGGPGGTCRVARFAYRWDAAAGAYDELSPAGGELAPLDGLWVFAARDDVELRVAMPRSERDAR